MRVRLQRLFRTKVANNFHNLYFSEPNGSDICPSREIKVKPDSPDTMKGALYSPNSPNFYPNDQSCTLTLDVPDNYKTVVWFEKFSLQCKTDKRYYLKKT